MAQYLSVLALSSLDGNNGFRLTGAAAYNYSGFSVSSAGDVNGDGFDDVIVGAFGASPNGGSSGSSYVVFGKASGFGASLALSSLDGNNGFRLDGVAAGDRSGVSVSDAGDVNGDGIADVIVAAHSADPNGSYSGSSYVVFGTNAGFSATFALSSLDGNNGFRIDGVATLDFSGLPVSSAGDVNGDGIDDLIVGAYRADPNGTSSGSSYVVFGTDTGFSATVALSSLDGNNGFRVDGVAAFTHSGFPVSSAGDVNGDGIDDIVIGAYKSAPNGSDSGSSYVVFGTDAGFGATLALSSLDGNNGFRIDGVAAGDHSGRFVSSAGDVNGDGIGDLIVGARGADPNGNYSGSSYVVLGTDGGFGATLALSSLDGNNGFRLDGAVAYDHSGYSVSSAGDFNGDGFADLIVGAWQANPNGNDSGASYVVFGKASGFGASLALSSLDGNNGFRLNGVATGDKSGVSVSSAGDVNGDGFDDLIVGAYRAAPNGTGSGASYVIFGGMPGEAVVRTGTAIDNTIHGGNFDDTLSGLGGNDTLLGHEGEDTLLGGSGKDTLIGDKGKDVLTGGGSKDLLDGGKSADRFVFTAASNSTGLQHDTIKKADFAQDRFDTTAAVSAIDSAVTTGTLSKNSFDGDLAGAVGAGELGANHALLFTADAGNLAGKTFLIVDLNGTAGYQAGADLVIELRSAVNLGSIDAGDFI